MASTFCGVLKKMETEFGNPVAYYLVFENDLIAVNQAIGWQLDIQFAGYRCLSCHKTKPIYRQGFCKSCFFESPKAGAWIIRPELSTAHLGKPDRNLDYECKIQMQPHIVYLAYSGGLKVGVTRKTQIPTRWIDQGADQALVIMEIPNRYLAGITEVAIKTVLGDKTNWRKMLTTNSVETSLEQARDEIQPLLPAETSFYYTPSEQVQKLEYPLTMYPEKVSSLNIEKDGSYQGKLVGIKGQYLVFADGTVLNVRGNEGLVVKITILK